MTDPNRLSTLIARLRHALDDLDRARALLDRINVFPVADGDTGTNMTATLRAPVDAIETLTDPTGTEVARLLRDRSFRAARGNSGIILAAWLGGASESLTRSERVDAAQVADVLRAAARATRAAIAEPRDGTILTVADAAAVAAAGAAAHGASLGGLLDAVADRALDAVRATPDDLDVLRSAGVVDAGGLGLLVVLAALAGTSVDLTEFDHGAAEPGVPDALDADLVEVMLELEADAGDPLREAWAALGTSIAVTGANGRWHAHIHTTHPDAAIEAARRHGTISHVRQEAVGA